MVLVVDDEPVALAVLQRTLEPHYQVLTASDGLEALDIIKAWGSVVQVVVTARDCRKDALRDSISYIGEAFL